MSTELARQFDSAPMDRVEVTIVYAFEPAPQIERALHKSKVEKRLAQAALSDAIADRGALVQTDLQRAGIGIVHRSRMYPAIFALATREQIGGLETDPRILRVGLTRHPGQEEPDVVTLADDVLVPSLSDAARLAGTNDWWTDRVRHFPVQETAVSGTSFAAPVVAAAVALMKDACNNRQPGSIAAQLARARVMAGAYLSDPFGDGGYSTPIADCDVGTSCDHKDGTGLLYGDALLDFCGYHLTKNDSSSGTFDLDPLGDPAQYNAPTPNDPKYGPTKAAAGLGSVFLKRGQTLREVISWQTCAHYRTRGDLNLLRTSTFGSTTTRQTTG